MPHDDDLLRQLRSIFMVEAREHVQAMGDGLLRLEGGGPAGRRTAAVDAAFRAAHSLKGAAHAVELAEIEMLCQSLEDVFAAWRGAAAAPRPEATDALYRALDAIAAMLAALAAQPGAPLPDTAALRAELRRHAAPTATPAAGAATAPGRPPEPDAPPPRTASGQPPSASEDTVRVPLPKLESHLLEAEELLTLKFAAGQRVAELRELAGRLDDWRRSAAHPRGAAPSRDAASAQGTEPAQDGAAPPGADALRAIDEHIAAIARAARHDQDLAGRRVDDVVGNARKLLLLPFSTISASFPRLVRDLCREQGKQAELAIHGGQTDVDRLILEEIKDPLVHMLRNAVDHAIETPALRAAQGKPARAAITLSVAPADGNKIELRLSDDGAGIDRGRLKDAALARGLLTREEAQRLDDDAALDLVFQPEVSTRAAVTQVSGRGLGLAIVREKAQALGGSATVRSEAGRGTTFRIVLPAARAASRGVLVKAAGRALLLPTAMVERVMRVRPEDIRTVEGRETIALGARAVALVRLADALALPRLPAAGMAGVAETADGLRDGARDGIQAAVVGAGGDAVAFAVDQVLGEQEVLVKPLRRPLVRVRNVAAVAVLESGSIVPVLNPADLLRSARRAAGPPIAAQARAPAAAARRRVLVAEDSITSRMLLKSMLETAGYAVETAVDGMQAYGMLRAGAFDLLVSDVQMPRLDGFALTARLRADPALAELPVLLVTALGSREDRERGVEAGASAYIVKSSLEQGDLLATVARLIR